MQTYILEEHRNLSNQELIKLYGPNVINNIYRYKKYMLKYMFLEPALTPDGANWHEGSDSRRKLGLPIEGKIPKEFVYKLPGKRSKRKEAKSLDKSKKYDKIKVLLSGTSKKRLSCLKNALSVDAKTQN